MIIIVIFILAIFAIKFAKPMDRPQNQVTLKHSIILLSFKFILILMQSQTFCSIFLFVNSASGGGIGNDILSEKIQKLQFEITLNNSKQIIHLYFFDLTVNRNKLFMKVKDVISLGRRTIGVICGGDGTIMWVISQLNHYQIDPNKIPLAILPLGTGNDFSQYLGWGKQTKKNILQSKYKELKKLVRRWLAAKEEQFDIWDVVAEVQEKRGKFQKVNKQSKNQLIQGNTLRRSFCNYFSFGIDGKVGYSFDKYRTNSRIGNLMVYGAMGVIKSATKTKTIKQLVQKMEIRHKNNDYEKVDFSTSPLKEKLHQIPKKQVIFSSQKSKEQPYLESDYHNMLFLNIGNYMGGVRDIWTKAGESSKITKKWHEQSSEDGEIQIISFSSSVGLALQKIIGGFGKKIGQGQGPYMITFKESSEEKHRTYLQIDGEFIRFTHPKSLLIRKSCLSENGKIRVLKRNQDNQSQ